MHHSKFLIMNFFFSSSFRLSFVTFANQGIVHLNLTSNRFVLTTLLYMSQFYFIEKALPKVLRVWKVKVLAVVHI